MSTSHSPRIVVVTGASAGVGRATAREFGRRGDWVGLLSRDQGRLQEAQKEIEAEGGRAVAIPTDVSDPDQVEAAAQRIEDELGPIDIWVNNAMVSVFKPFTDVTPEEFKRVTEVTYLGAVNGTRSALKRMKPRNSGVIVQVGSALAYRGIPLQSAYCGAKHAIQGFTESVRTEIFHDQLDIHITMVQMPALNTPQFSWVRTNFENKPQPVPPIYQPEVAARAIIWAAEHRRRELNVGMPTSLTKFVNTIAPSLVDRYLALTGYASQQTDEPIEPDRKDNLFESVPGPYGAHGVFDDRSTNFSPQLQLTTHQGLVAAIGVAAAAIGGMVYLMRAN